MFSKNKKRIWIVIIILIAILPFLNIVKNRIFFDIMIDAIEENNISKLERSLVIGNPNYVKGIALLDHICEVPYKKTPLQLACYKGNFGMVKLLVEKGADVNYTKINAMSSPLICAIEGQSENDLEIVKYLIEKGADVNYERLKGWSMINILINSNTVSPNSVEIIKCLVEAGVNMDRINPLHQALRRKHNDIIKFFVEELDYLVEGGGSIINYCKGINSFSPEIFELLISNGANIYETDEDGKNAVD